MALQGNPWAGTDFGGYSPKGNEDPDDPTKWVNNLPGRGPQPQAPGAPPSPPSALPADISPDMDPVEGFNRAYRYLSSLIANPKTQTINNPISPQNGQIIEDPTWANQLAMAQKEVDYFANVFAKQGDTERAKEAQRLADAAAKERSQISANASITSAGISAGASAFSAQEATRRQQLADANALTRLGITGEQSMAERNLVESGLKERLGISEAGANTRLGISEAGANERLGKEQTFNAEQNRLNREIQNMANQLAAGRINMETALGTIDKWLQAQQYTLPQGAQYVPGFQPGGGVQEAARLAGVSYNPANYKANTVPFDPAAVVRQTMGR